VAQIDFNEVVKEPKYRVTARPVEDPRSLAARLRRENWRFFAALAIVGIATPTLAYAYFATADANTKEWAQTLLNTIFGAAIAIALGAGSKQSGD
jgi:hypothetical protein